jgi:chemotaxis protein CheX
MTIEFAEPFLASAVSTFSTMLGCKLIPGEPFIKGDLPTEHEVTGVIGLSGKAKGAVALSLCREAALSASAAMLGQRPSDVNHDVTDAVGELTNMIAGGAKARLEHLSLSASLPTVIVGQGHVMEFPYQAAPVCIPFECPWGQVIVEVGLIEQQEG